MAVRLVRPTEPGTYYTYAPVPVVVDQPMDRARARALHQADVRLRRAVRAAWTDPSLARQDCLAVGAQYAALQDAQGMANAFIAHAEAQCADACYAGLARLDKHGKPTFGAQSHSRAKEEYLHATSLYSALEERRIPNGYSYPRQSPTHTALHALCKRDPVKRPFAGNIRYAPVDKNVADLPLVSSWR